MNPLLNIPIKHVCCPNARGGAGVATAPAARKRASNGGGAFIYVALSVFLLSSFATAQTLSGTVRNSTSGKPSAGDEVVALELGHGMEESARAQTDAGGRFLLKLKDPQAAHLVRVIHQGVTYHRMAPPAATSVAVEVFDVAKKVDGIKVFADLMRIRTAGGQLAVTRQFAVQNISNPPRTQMDEHNLEFYVPENAHVIVDSAMATFGNGIPLKSAPVPEGENRYAFLFPLRPGVTRFAVKYTVPYGGSANVNPKSIYPLEHFVVTFPKGMQFKTASSSSRFKLLDVADQPNATVEVASNVSAGQDLAFNISGEGAIDTRQQNDSAENEQRSAATAELKNRPGGGLGPPIDAPDPLQKYRWWILGGAAAFLLMGGIYVASRPRLMTGALRHQRIRSSLVPAMQKEGHYERPDAGILEETRVPVDAGSSYILLMDGIREELFQIEVEHKQGQISQAEYEKARAALDQTLDRALQREGQRA